MALERDGPMYSVLNSRGYRAFGGTTLLSRPRAAEGPLAQQRRLDAHAAAFSS
jgi:hypothetical protein